jgi:hypothetical protein
VKITSFYKLVKVQKLREVYKPPMPEVASNQKMVAKKRKKRKEKYWLDDVKKKRKMRVKEVSEKDLYPRIISKNVGKRLYERTGKVFWWAKGKREVRLLAVKDGERRAIATVEEIWGKKMIHYLPFYDIREMRVH